MRVRDWLVSTAGSLLCIVLIWALWPTPRTSAQGTPVEVRYREIQPVYVNQITVGTTAAALPEFGVDVNGICFKAFAPAQTIYFGLSSSVTASDGFAYEDGEGDCFEVPDPTTLYFIASASGQEIHVLGYRRH